MGEYTNSAPKTRDTAAYVAFDGERESKLRRDRSVRLHLNTLENVGRLELEGSFALFDPSVVDPPTLSLSAKHPLYSPCLTYNKAKIDQRTSGPIGRFTFPPRSFDVFCG